MLTFTYYHTKIIYVNNFVIKTHKIIAE